MYHKSEQLIENRNMILLLNKITNILYDGALTKYTLLSQVL